MKCYSRAGNEGRGSESRKDWDLWDILYCCRTNGTVAAWNIPSACPPLSVTISDCPLGVFEDPFKTSFSGFSMCPCGTIPLILHSRVGCGLCCGRCFVHVSVSVFPPPLLHQEGQFLEGRDRILFSIISP
uniref:Uncharacterized protein n=1 Tax=Canis lupus dingo TaxID=286419 RepID=A0A8C0QY41_CANLU